ncbi:hypothetical protein EV198_0140 [Roseivirga ehrenbergii]|uniref:Apea-like HEPN domain-containing protein n=1 Tax=Roseivirga ehrenbergii (strain DSM 102268 / JCM 13514 / KCTC 12282 / NCIMB 14502 / KMM 6017) TaxID=279360 RepID=A0A150X023_ROSEK|nr:hypothetical protein [Roseivirga ehrenbergii]KYG72090.1 hypothetical protein MB14_08540 [Roseivirga ehrenbergii]TCL13318.1 hypothetical protein EV198_0140 [Roseivirga ehrenbergii]
MSEKFTEIDIQTQYALIGEFVVRFEDINDWLRFLIPKIIFPDKQSKLQTQNIGSLIENITADPLRSKFDSLISDSFTAYPKLSQLNLKLSSKIVELPQIRNTIVHGAYRLGWKDFEGNLSSDTLSVQHSKATKKGFEKRSKIISTKTLENLNRDMIKVSKSYNYIGAIIDCLNHHNLPEQADKYLIFLDKEIDSFNKMKLDEILTLN